jgi:hypothetical protein
MAGKRTKVTLFFFFFYFGKQLSETSLLLLQTEFFFLHVQKEKLGKGKLHVERIGQTGSAVK